MADSERSCGQPALKETAVAQGICDTANPRRKPCLLPRAIPRVCDCTHFHSKPFRGDIIKQILHMADEDVEACLAEQFAATKTIVELNEALRYSAQVVNVIMNEACPVRPARSESYVFITVTAKEQYDRALVGQSRAICIENICRIWMVNTCLTDITDKPFESQ